jgi:Methyltransferase domain
MIFFRAGVPRCRGALMADDSDDIHSRVIASISDDKWGAHGYDAWQMVQDLSRKMGAPRILELGTRQTIPGKPTRHQQRYFPHAGEYLGTDIEMGPDVDFVADVHRLTETTGKEAFDIIFTEAGFEHFKYPHLAAHEIMKALKVGGLAFAQTHQTFPLHGVPYDYFRFSVDAMRSLFGAAMGMKVLTVSHACPAAIYSRVDPGSYKYPAFLHVNILAEKVAPTPEQFVYEFDCLTDGVGTGYQRPPDARDY